MRRTKPLLKLRNDGSIELVVPGFHGLTECQLVQAARQKSGSLLAYCQSLKLNYVTVRAALKPFAHGQAGSVGYMRLVLGLPVEPRAHSLCIAEKVHGDTRLRAVLGPDLVVVP
ncbi:MAG: hypothetical protein E6Q67_09510 [Roseateles sp.]|nr:MAG: hypothetical protein E6Q67_09510 [Roseateles sp.]